MKKYEDVNTPLTVLIGILSALLIFVIIVCLQIGYYRMYEDQYYQKVVTQKSDELIQLTADQQERLYSYRWINEASQAVAIPIDVAMDLVVKDEQAKR
jgi:hypothetical protein